MSITDIFVITCVLMLGTYPLLRLVCVSLYSVDRHSSQLLQCSVQLLLSYMCLIVSYDTVKHAIYHC